MKCALHESGRCPDFYIFRMGAQGFERSDTSGSNREDKERVVSISDS